MRKIYLAFVVTLTSFILPLNITHATVWTIINIGNTYSPASITITLGDTVVFSIGGGHNVVEVSQATYNANGSTSNGGFTLPFGGGTYIPTQVQTYYFVCVPHASLGMKGLIIVDPSSGIPSVSFEDRVLKFLPNPVATQTQIHTGIPDGFSNRLIVFDITGKAILELENISNNHVLDAAIFRKGIYFVEFKSEGYRRTSKLVITHK